jgi:hypothetical protein
LVQRLLGGSGGKWENDVENDLGNVSCGDWMWLASAKLLVQSFGVSCVASCVVLGFSS